MLPSLIFCIVHQDDEDTTQGELQIGALANTPSQNDIQEPGDQYKIGLDVYSLIQELRPKE
jgi:hypothetical protein